MGESLNGLKRTIMCGEIRENHIGNRVVVMGWVQRKRNLGGLVFVDLRDREGILQVVFGEEINKDAFMKADLVKSEYCISVSGTLVKRESPNPNMPTGMVELKGEEIKILSESETPPIYIKENLDAAENIRLRYRYLDLRRPDMQKIFKIRHKTTKIIRDFMDEENFLEMETPILTKSTPEGARDYLVPSRNYNGKFYALPQSPQLFKQLLMVSGYDKYFQIAKCFRDEDLRANRQPEFTQVDMEMSFVEEDDVIELNERLIQKVFKEMAGVEVKLPIERMTWKTAMEKYGSDKPDLRFGMEINDISEAVSTSDFKVFKSAIEEGGSVRAIKAPNSADMPRKKIDKLGEFVKTYKAKGLAWIALKEDGIKSPIAKFLKEEELKAIIDKVQGKTGDLILIVADKNSVVFQSLGALRLEIAKELEILKDNKEFRFVWITEFPLLSYNEEEERFQAEHHPFTMPMDEDIEYLESDPGRVRAKAYDIVLNGEELGGGSVRIHDTALQERMFKVLGFTKESAWERFSFLLEAFKFGPPPHAGLAYGLDRLIMFLAGTENIKDVIAFPKNQNAFCPLTEAPNVVDENQIEELGIKVESKEEE
ncbi:aspartyl-tRNA synthetase [Clostridium acetobutylicum]|uniref:Aspartate--tRNA ligase n=1 Tax=Clostridium acetobutylicum (strain ATCC 824 / DSM 792 / JCM 1419 / IAM 19013 / LMG 5710 / NBRC 13948 / NRRL B-527 / VKM B-1787 / 2291 / W) TaxID=272562 RepID=SYD_CLOAB|nr:MULTISPECIES: aspartate--tRNA ligase [Clostridium]Q97GU6.1 RecName: Full=Aspartate--tRNA ligase; AltName: Full=Aspartyl-tRNA synthetase; Short=AspRS [Clostridium acetobutylicum ATCC 824]AAK80226.1 Aspartyl-tRNA synthetase [Clostridium acetobutylicum ATCC 824]ADZ21321.1 aspartyl-tRNA synthetase [Clostridium acetobutylicum EA 2018]AEI34620.1 aspartyl-tRNA synthetase [Clostridium acetobutylicum DSM 1731]AWV79351.1 aspartate--tRNA ligase [Clostridium acetobutylicum]MBC2394678.1 aspartate--tRNA